jgi:hypothetical protein
MAKQKVTGLYDRIIEHMKRRMLFVDDLAPGPLCSLGSVIANTKQANEPFHWVFGDDEDLGVNITLVAPSGFAKSHTMKQFVHRTKGISPFKSTFRGKITEAGFVGTINKDGEAMFGDAYNYSDGILAFNEIANLFCAQEQENSSELINQVMEALTERRISKRLAYGTVDYPTLVTIWGGIQPRRFDFSQGLGRRFLFVCRNWTEEDMKAFKLLRRNRENIIKLDMEEVQEIRTELAHALETFAVSEIKWEGDILRFIEDKCESHLQMQMLEKVLIGKETLNQYDKDTLVIHNNDANKELVEMVARMQSMVAEGSDVSLLINVLQAHENDHVTMGELWDVFRAYNYNLSGFQELLATCNRLKVVTQSFQGSKMFITLRDDLRGSAFKTKTAEEIIEELTKYNI